MTKFSYATKGGMNIRNPGKTNQDQYIIEPLFDGLRDTHLFGVCDGHGIYGKEVSQMIKQIFPNILKRHIGTLLRS